MIFFYCQFYNFPLAYSVSLHHKPEHSPACAHCASWHTFSAHFYPHVQFCVYALWMEWVSARRPLCVGAAFVSVSARNRRGRRPTKVAAQTKHVAQFQMNELAHFARSDVQLKGFVGVRQSAPWICLRRRCDTRDSPAGHWRCRPNVRRCRSPDFDAGRVKTLLPPLSSPTISPFFQSWRFLFDKCY